VAIHLTVEAEAHHPAGVQVPVAGVAHLMEEEMLHLMDEGVPLTEEEMLHLMDEGVPPMEEEVLQTVIAVIDQEVRLRVIKEEVLLVVEVGPRLVMVAVLLQGEEVVLPVVALQLWIRKNAAAFLQWVAMPHIVEEEVLLLAMAEVHRAMAEATVPVPVEVEGIHDSSDSLL
jgi:hypothetical protein